jgi:hypothetical protein
VAEEDYHVAALWFPTDDERRAISEGAAVSVRVQRTDGDDPSIDFATTTVERDE